MLRSQPAGGVVITALRAVAVSARVVAVAIVVARIASVDFSTEWRGSAQADVGKGTFVRWQHALAIKRIQPICPSGNSVSSGAYG